MTINSVRTIEFDNDGSKLTVDATTWLPATPTLLIFCCGYRLLPKKVKRGGKDVPHGNLLYLDCTPSMFNPVSTGGTEFHWEVANEDYVPNCKDCHLAIVELAEQPKLDWTTQVYECPPVPTGAVRFDGATFFSTRALAAADSPFLSISFWYRSFSDQSSGTTWISDPNGDASYLEFLSTVNKVAILTAEEPFPPSDGGKFQFGSGIDASFGEWHHCAYNINVGAGAGAKTGTMMLDRVPVGVITRDEGEAFTLNVAGFPFAYGGDTNGNNTTFDVFDLWIAFGQEVNFADTAVLNLFVTADLKPVPLGDHGELPTGEAPTIYGHGGANEFLQPNLGTGGDLALFGALIDTDGPNT